MERVISDVCMFRHMFLWRLSDILTDLKDMGQIPSPWLSYFVSFLSPLPCWALKTLRIIFLNL